MINNIKNGEIIKTNNKNTELIALSYIIKIFKLYPFVFKLKKKTKNCSVCSHIAQRDL